MLLSPKPGIIYGPVASRRLGSSLGINLLPRGQKACTFDCAYCQYGWTPRLPSAADAFPTVDVVLAAVEETLRSNTAPFAFLTFSGHGEPTTHPRFLSIVEGVRVLRDRYRPTAKIAVLSNSTRLTQPSVREALDLVDARIMKLDAGTEAMFQRYCRPLEPVALDDIVGGLASLRDVTLQALFAAGPGGNADPAHVAAWAGKVVAIRPIDVQIHTLDRSWPSAEIAPLDALALHAMAQRLRESGCAATVYSRG